MLWIAKVCLILFFVLGSPVLWAAGIINVNEDGVAAAWDNSAAISYHLEAGTCGDFNNAAMATKIAADFAEWSGPSEVDLSFTAVLGDIGQVGIDNFDDYFYVPGVSDVSVLTDGRNPIIFDDDAEISASIVGEANKYLLLGFAGPAAFSTDGAEIVMGHSVINCRCLTSHPSGPCFVSGGNGVIEVTENELDATIVHELGHFLNLDHSQVNSQLFQNGDADDDQHLPIMFPFSFDPDAGSSLRQDDIVSVAALYPSDTFSDDYCTVTGTLKDSDGEDLRCVDVWATVDGAIARSTSSTSGSYGHVSDQNDDGDTSDAEDCTEDCGTFTLYLEVGQTYSLYLKEIDSSFVGSSGVGPCRSEQLNFSPSSDPIAEVSSAICNSGAAIDLGEITTSISSGSSDSGGGTDSGTSGSDDIGSDGGGEAGGSGFDPKLNPVGYGCSLRTKGLPSSGPSQAPFLWGGLCYFVLLLLRQSFAKNDE